MIDEPELQIERMEYRPFAAEMEDSSQPGELLGSAFSSSGASAACAPPHVRIKELEAQLNTRDRAHQQQIEEARGKGREDGKNEIELLARSENARLSEQMNRALESFRKERDEYFSQVEQEVVHLALAIAERILHREAQMDPLLLSAAVRVALEKVSASTKVRLRVPVLERVLWDEMVNLIPNRGLRPQVVGDESLNSGDCFFETDLDSVDLGVRSQLAEVERGFFDLLEHRPASSRQSAPVECA